MRNAATAALLAFACLFSCTKQERAVSIRECNASLTDVHENYVRYSHKFEYDIAPTGHYYKYEMIDRDDYIFYMPEAKGYIEVKYDLLPFHIFGKYDTSGDYYAIDGQIIVHNGVSAVNPAMDKYTDKVSSIIRGEYGYYMDTLSIAFNLLNSKGEAIPKDSLGFMQTPQPQTTIGSTVYTTGFNIGVKAQIQVGAAKVDESVPINPDEQITDPDGFINIESMYKEVWKGTCLGLR